MKVKNLILYQVATDRDYKVGDMLQFNKETQNGQYNRVYKTNFLFNNDKPSNEMYAVAKRKFKKFKEKEDIYKIAHILENYDVLVKELAMEEVRKEKFPDLPSRLNCMYLSINKEIALNNLKSMVENKEKSGKRFQVIAVKLNGIIFKAGKICVNREAKSFLEYKEMAESYWQQKGLKDEEVKEILFEGVAEVVEILDEYIVK